MVKSESLSIIIMIKIWILYLWEKMISEWIDTKKKLPPEGKWVLI